MANYVRFRTVLEMSPFSDYQKTTVHAEATYLYTSDADLGHVLTANAAGTTIDLATFNEGSQPLVGPVLVQNFDATYGLEVAYTYDVTANVEYVPPSPGYIIFHLPTIANDIVLTALNPDNQLCAIFIFGTQD